MSAVTRTIVAFFKVLLAVYDIATLPIYIVFHKPWIHWKRQRSCFAKPIIDGDPSSPYKRLDNLEFENLKGVQTLDEMVRRVIRLNLERPALGTRPVLQRIEERQPNGKVFKKLVLGDYEWLTYDEVDRKIDLTARGLLSIGVMPRQYLAILAETRVEWMLTAQACFRINVPLVTLYATLSDDDIVTAIRETEVTHLVTSEDLLTRVLSILNRMALLTHVVCIENATTKLSVPLAGYPQVISFSSLQERNMDYDPKECAPTPDDVAIVMFTSGSSGVPKGVMATHRNLLAAINGFGTVCQSYGLASSDDTYIAYLPLAHMLELTVELLTFSIGARIGYSSPLTLTDNSSAVAQGSAGDVTLLQPTQVACVPLIVDRIRKGVTELASTKGPLFEVLFDYAVQYKNFWLDLGFDTPLLNLLIFNGVQLLLGGKVKILASGSAPLSTETRRFVRACFCCSVIEAYGTTETCAAAAINHADDTSVDRVGPPLPGCYIRLVDWSEGMCRTSDKPNPRGEVVVGGACVTQGYFKNNELTRELFREEGGIRWFYTGDIGEIFPDGTLKIIDRKKDLVKLQLGEYVSLGYVESVLKTCPLVDNVFAYGSSLHNYLVVFVVPNQKQLRCIARKLGKQEGLTLKELCDDAAVSKASAEFIMAFAAKSNLQKREVPLKVKLCNEPWTPDTGLVTPTLKIRRKPLQNFYQSDIDALYASRRCGSLSQS